MDSTRPPRTRMSLSAGSLAMVTARPLTRNHTTRPSRVTSAPAINAGPDRWTGARLCWRTPERHRLDRFVSVIAAAGNHGHGRRRRRHRQVAAAAVLDLDQGASVAGTDAQAAARDVDDVARAQPARAGQRHAVAERRIGARHRLEVELPVVQREPRQRRAVAAGQHDRVARAADAEREIRRRQRPFAERVAQDQFDGAQIGSSQRTTSIGAAAPGNRFSSLRTSR